MLNLKSLELNSLIIIGSSTGGPSHIKNLVQSLPASFVGTIVIAQHMADLFVPTFIKHMDSLSKLDVVLAEDGSALECAKVYIVSNHCSIVKGNKGYMFSVDKLDGNGYNPNINVLFSSCSLLAHEVNTLGIILTGIGDDGATGMQKLCSTPAQCISENEESAIVYGMPQRAKELCPRVKLEPFSEILQIILRFGA